MGEPQLHEITYRNERTGKEIRVPAPSHRDYRTFTIQLRGVFSTGDLDDHANAERYADALFGLAVRVAPDHKAEFDTWRIDEIDAFLSSYIRGCELQLYGDDTLDAALKGEGTADPK